MFTIHKYRLGSSEGLHSVEMPAGATILSAGADPDGHVCVWALVDTTAPLTARLLYSAWTGGDLPLNLAERMAPSLFDGLVGVPARPPFRGTAVSKTGIVVHVFEV